MDPEEVIELFDYYWFGPKIFKKQHPNLQNSSDFEANTDYGIQENPRKPEISRVPILHRRSLSDQLSSKAGFNCGSVSPDTVLLSPKLRTILSGKEITEPEKIKTTDLQVSSKKKVTGSRKKRGETKSLSALEFEELKGFMDLGFVFSEEDRNSSLASVVPGLQRFGKKDEEEDAVDESATSRPYLSEAWEVLDRRKSQNPLMNWKITALSDDIDMKNNLKWWAHTVASTVR
ncbi:hypothetical protein I3760_10G060500 [Carya illinoinensis]|uniref:DUF1685 domain-containing protein n=1 Tax=Carya illinoinensis TaxID=32201 RepID=A0A8T1PAY6_CARIL|nr:uncharacterized protein LOC122278362 [Carya illinoinensis]KAG2684033.1 hypothetical protein I3760_10G060500 [Carya illinoinensis]KAG6638854.1 hypothetical protein CIPAW_10G061300 [Carya illinoinensis]KAG6691340.1 hypothetical protein I3842_10G060700 [Carya illinoinensis]